MTDQSPTTAAEQPWYLEPDALAIIAGLTGRPETEFARDVLGGKRDGGRIFVGAPVAALQRYWTRRFKQIDAIRPWPEGTMKAVCGCASEQDVLAAMFGPAAGYAGSEQIERWFAIRDAINAALDSDERLAA